MAAIDPKALENAMNLAGVSPVNLAKRVGISDDYMRNIRSGYRTLKRNPELRKAIAQALDVPIRWIEHQPSSGEEAA